MPPVYATISFFSFRFFRAYTYYALVEAIYEALAVAAFLMLLIQFVGESTEEQKKVLAEKSKRKIPIPFCCWRYRPSKPYFMYTLKARVIRNFVSIFGFILTISTVVCSAILYISAIGQYCRCHH